MDRGNEEPNKEESMKIEADALCNVIRNEATGPFTGRGNCTQRELEVCALFIMGIKITRKIKEQLQSQVHDKSMRKYLIQQETWMRRQFEGIDWTSYGTACKRMERSRQTEIVKACDKNCEAQPIL
jgi:hypothetical protein